MKNTLRKAPLLLALLLGAGGCGPSSFSADPGVSGRALPLQPSGHLFVPAEDRLEAASSVREPVPDPAAPRDRRIREPKAAGIAASAAEPAPSAASAPDAAPAVEPAPDPGIVPVRIEIPAIGVDSEVVKVGLLEDGRMEAPEDYHAGGWFEPGFRPGAPGSAVIAGHVDHYTGPAVFFDLKRLQPGDRIVVSDDSGDSRTFLVERLERYDAEDAPLELIFGASGEARLNLITCSGPYNRKTKQRDERLVVFAKLESRV